ncbi:hypothetical protein D6D15_07146 [Aureobasidium pullulans]|uniref:Peptidase M43 pregnancy-associated plasma-A domain-containing protein n=1 Tax=Aureobasidium pullulans TaxID=5580 RepID=A0A4S9B262_AURPU|nr:hypothetical protein D6D15_07146 [Aureobasidium pullulans]
MRTSILLTVAALVGIVLAHPHPHQDPPQPEVTEDARLKGNDVRILNRPINRASTAASLETTTWDPPAGMVSALEEVWTETLKRRPNGQGAFDKNREFIPKLMANYHRTGAGKIDYCVAMSNERNVTVLERANMKLGLQRVMQEWVDTLVGFEGFPITKVDLDVISYAVTHRSQVQGDTTGLDIFTTSEVDNEGTTKCDPRCYRDNLKTSTDGETTCPGGEKNMFDMELRLAQWPMTILGFGAEWGQAFRPWFIFRHTDDDMLWTLRHEMGHSFGLIDFGTDTVPTGQENFVMRGHRAAYITEFDAWMLRDWWMKLKAHNGW